MLQGIQAPTQRANPEIVRDEFPVENVDKVNLIERLLNEEAEPNRTTRLDSIMERLSRTYGTAVYTNIQGGSARSIANNLVNNIAEVIPNHQYKLQTPGYNTDIKGESNQAGYLGQNPEQVRGVRLETQFSDVIDPILYGDIVVPRGINSLFNGSSWLVSQGHSPLLHHYFNLLLQWDLLLVRHERFFFPRHPLDIANNVELFSRLAVLDGKELGLLCRLLVPEELFALHSRTYMGYLFTLLTGGIVPKEQDPTLDWDIWSKFAPLSVSDIHKISSQYAAAIPEFGLPFVASNSYTMISDPRFQPALDWVSRCVSYQGNATYAYPGFIREEKTIDKYTPGERQLLDEMDVIPDLYSAYEHYPIRQLSFLSVPYLMYKYLGLNRPELPEHFDRLQTNFNPEDVAKLRRYSFIVGCHSDKEMVAKYMPFYYDDDDLYPRLSKSRFHRKEWNLAIVEAYATELGGWLIGKVKRCNNDDNLDIIMGEPRRQARDHILPQDFEDDPTLVLSVFIYGGRRRCFQVSELEASFQQTENGFEFLDPDYRVPKADRLDEQVVFNIDPVSSEPIQKVFKIENMISLYSFLKEYLRITYIVIDERRKVAIRRLYDKLYEGLGANLQVSRGLNDEKELIKSHPEWYNDLLILFTWLMLFSIWIRFWPGPGHPYKLRWKEEMEGTCVYNNRDLNIDIELSVYGMMMRRLEVERPEIYKFWIELPFIHFDWNTGEVTRPIKEKAIHAVGTHTVNGIIDSVQHGTFCMAQASDYLSGTAYIYLTEVFDIPKDRLNDLLLHVMGLLYNYEKAAIDSKRRVVLASNEWIDTVRQYNVNTVDMHSRILNVRDPGFVQPPLDLSLITETRHLPQGMAELLGMEI